MNSIALDDGRFYARISNGAGALTAAFFLLSSMGANAAPTRLDCTLTKIRLRAGEALDLGRV
jgi:hypothetical protein